MKTFLLVALVILIGLPASATSEDYVASYMEKCTSNGINSETFCECALKVFSDQHRDGHKKALISRESKIAAREATILSDPAMTKDKIDAVYKLYESILENQALAGQASMKKDMEGYKKYSDKARTLDQQRKDLVRSYTANRTTYDNLISSNYSRDRNLLDQMKKDLAEDEDSIYPFVRRMLGSDSNNLVRQILRIGLRSNCPK